MLYGVWPDEVAVGGDDEADLCYCYVRTLMAFLEQ